MQENGDYIVIEALVFPCTYKCNGRCIMCTIYNRKEEDLPVSFFEPFFSHPMLSRLRSINLTGGEPTLRRDLPQLVKMITTCCPKLREIIINTNGFHTKQILKKIQEIHEILPSGIKFWVYVSLDAIDESAEIVRGIPQAHLLAMQTIQALLTIRKTFPRVNIGISCTITSSNYDKLEDVYKYALNIGVSVDFIYATVNSAYINSKEKKDNFILSPLQEQQVINFFEILKKNSKISSSRNYYEMLINQLRGEYIYKPCIFREKRGLLLEADGKVSLCGMTSQSLLGDLKKDSLDDILLVNPKGMGNYCVGCQTNSYYNWSDNAQKTIQSDVLNIVKQRRKSIYKKEISK